jgi:hypothetical protein
MEVLYHVTKHSSLSPVFGTPFLHVREFDQNTSYTVFTVCQMKSNRFTNIFVNKQASLSPLHRNQNPL